MRIARQDVGRRGQAIERSEREMRGAIQRVALCEIDQDRRDLTVLATKIDARDHVGLVFLSGEGRGLPVRGGTGERIDREAADAAVGIGIGVQRNKEIGAPGARDPDALRQRNVEIAVARQMDNEGTGLLEQTRKSQSLIEDEILLQYAVDPARARVETAMAGIDDDDFLLSGTVDGLLRRRSKRCEALRRGLLCLEVLGPR